MARNEKIGMNVDLRGLDLVTPVDLMKDGRTPFAKNFRLYAQQSDDRRVAVSSRKGPGEYTKVLSEVQDVSNTSTTGASTAHVGVIAGLQAQPFTVTASGRISKIDLSLSNPDSASGPVIVSIYEDNDGVIGKLLSKSSILNGNISDTAQYLTAHFINAPLVTTGDTLWFILQVQDDGEGEYKVSTTTAGTKAWASDTSIASVTEQAYALNFKTYIAPDMHDKGSYRFNRENGQNITVAAFGTAMYRLDATTKDWVKLVDGFNANATEYSFTNGDGKVFWVNAYDDLTAWNGTEEETAANMVTNPSFDTNTTGWAGGSGTTLARSTSEFYSSPASLSATAASGTRSANYAVNLVANKRYKITYWTKGASASGNTQVVYNAVATGITGSVKPLTTGWVKNEFYFVPPVAVTTLNFQSTAVNFFIDDVSIIDTGVETIIDPELPILSDVEFHKDRIWGVAANDRNKLVFSENPGNPSNAAANAQWYYAWLSVSFIYVPRPKNGSPITGMVSFQDSLTVFTQDAKYVISGYDRGSFNLRQATGNKGAISSRGIIADENLIYFVGNDGFYEYNGSADKKISSFINPLFDGCGFKENITPIIWRNEVRFYMASQGSSSNNICVIYNKDLEETMMDTDSWANRAIVYGDSDDDNELVEFSSLIPTAYLAEQDYNSIGAPIDFEYRFKYDSFKAPAQKKRLRRYFPLIQGVDSSFPITLGMDKDFQDSPREKQVWLTVNGSLLGEFEFGDGTLLGGDRSFKQYRQSFSGNAYYWQFRIRRNAVNNRVAFIGSQYSYKTKRL